MAAASGRLCHHSPTRCSSLLGRECHIELQGWAGSSACSSAVQVSTDGLGPAPPFTNGPLRGWATPERKSQQSRTAGSQSVSPSQPEAHLASCKEGHFQNTGRWGGAQGHIHPSWNYGKSGKPRRRCCTPFGKCPTAVPTV